MSLKTQPGGGERMNKEKLEEEMQSQNISKTEMCTLLGISRSAFYRKCNGKSEFTLSEMQKILDVLNLNTPEGIFFAS